MIKKILVHGSVVVLLATAVLALGGPAPQKPNNVPNTQVSSGGSATSGMFLIDDFESGNLQSPRAWWTFDLQKVAVEPNGDLTAGDPGVVTKKGNYSLHLKGLCKNWYAGGCGVYFAKESQDLSKYGNVQLDVYGHGEGSGTVKIELYDEDNGNWQVEQDPAKHYAPIYDDKFVYSEVVDWQGWRRVTIPVSDFVDDNPGVGDDIWNPQQTNGSGGLLQIQLICLGSKDNSIIDLYVDNVALVNGEK